MADYTPSAYNAALKILYPRGLRYALYDKDPLLAFLEKTTNFVGRSKENTLMYEGVFGSANITTARANAGTAPFVTFTYTRKKDYSVGFLDLEAFHAAKSEKGALATLVKTATDAAIDGIANTTLHQIWGNGGGARGRISSGSTVGSTVITLANPEDVVHFGVGMVLQASAADGTSGSVKAGTVTLTKVDRSTGTLTASGNWSAGIGTVATGDYLFREGDFGLALTGILAHCPTSAPSGSDSFLGVNRSVDPERLAGVRVAANGADINEVLIDAAAIHSRAGGRPEVIIVNPLTMAAMAKEVHAKTEFTEIRPEKNVSIRAINIMTGMGPLKVMQSRGCPKNVALLTRRDNWELCGLGDWPHFANEHGLKYITTDRDAMEFRLKRYGDLICKKPVQNAIVTGLNY